MTAQRHGHVVFVTATDTGVGKTVATAALATALRRLGCSVGVMKPIETGVVPQRRCDAGFLKQAAQAPDPLNLIRPYVFRLPVAPLDAARAERRRIQLPVILKASRGLRSRHDVLLIEGVGGLRVPITAKADVLDLIETMRVPVLVVGRVELGGVNHALLTLDALRARKISVLALVLNHTTSVRTAAARHQAHSTVRLLREHAGVPVIGPLPYQPGLKSRSAQALSRLAENGEMRKLTKLVLASARENR